MAKFKYLILVFLYFISQKAIAQPKVICSMTINSTNEIEAFKKRLNTNDYEHIELAPKADLSKMDKIEAIKYRDGGWFEQACSEQVDCDVLIISAHFGPLGQFTGEALDSYSLTLHKMEEYACSAKCSGILNHPKEVYIFGCNSLANSQKAQSFEDFQRALGLGYDQESYQNTWQKIYGIDGNENLTRIQRVFSGVPVIYGFDSVAPAGAHIGPAIREFLTHIPRYSENLNQLVESQEKQNTQLISEKYINATSLLGDSGLVYTTGILNKQQAHQKELYCTITQPHNTKEQLLALREMISDLSFWNDFHSIREFLKSHRYAQNAFSVSEKFILRQASFANPEAATFLLSKLNELQTLGAKIDVVQFALDLGWLDESEVREYQKKFLKKFLFEGLTKKAQQTLTTVFEYRSGIYLKSEDLPSDWKTNPNTLEALSNMMPQDDEILKVVNPFMIKQKRDPLQKFVDLL